MLNESNISPKESKSRSGPPNRPAATHDRERKAFLKPAPAASLALSPSHTAGITTKPGSDNTARRRSGGFMTFPPEELLVANDSFLPHSHEWVPSLKLQPIDDDPGARWICQVNERATLQCQSSRGACGPLDPRFRKDARSPGSTASCQEH